MEQKFADIKKYAIENVPFYREYNVDDQFPVVTKEDLRKTDLFTSSGEYLKPLSKRTTSGTSGQPFSIFHDKVKSQRHIADLKVFGDLADYPSHERQMYLRSAIYRFDRTPEREANENIYYVECNEMNDANLMDQYEILRKLNPCCLHGYPHNLVVLAEFIEKHNLSLSGMHLKSILCSGEGVFENQRAQMARVFDVPIYSRYSNLECGVLGQDDGYGGDYRLNWGSFYFEVLALDSDRPAKEGEVGRIVVSDLTNKVVPIIRYDTKDLGIWKNGTNNEFPRITKIYGRVMDAIYNTKDQLVSPHAIDSETYKINTRRYYFDQIGKGEYNLFLCFDDNKQRNMDAIKNLFYPFLGNDARINIKIVDELNFPADKKQRNIRNSYKH